MRRRYVTRAKSTLMNDASNSSSPTPETIASSLPIWMAGFKTRFDQVPMDSVTVLLRGAR